MSNSSQLRQTITENPIGSDQSDKLMENIEVAVLNALIDLQANYSNYTIYQEKTLKKMVINQHLKDVFLDENIGTNLSSKRAHIRPDGGLIYTKISGRELLLGAIEGKTQGTNDKRIEEGKGRQALGNAIERSAKNFLELDRFLLGEDIFGYLIFANGCDLEDDNSSIRDRLTSLNLGSPFNNLYIHKIIDKFGKSHSRASIFIGMEDVDEISEVIFEMLDTSMEYYINKYGQNNVI